MGILDKVKIINRRLISDSRGYFLKVLTGTEEHLPAYTGEIYLTSAKPSEAKGGHYHPEANEWFTLLQGECRLELVDTTCNEKTSISLTSDIPQTVFIPSKIAHVFINTSSKADFLLLAYTDKLYDPSDTIPYDQFLTTF